MLSEEQLAHLAAPLEESRVSHKQGMSYLEAWDCIDRANRIFGYGGWSHTIERLEESRFGWFATVRVEAAGVVRSDVGFSPYEPKDGDFDKLRHSHFDMAIKGAVSDGLKRCLRTFGAQFGNTLYDKERVPEHTPVQQPASKLGTPTNGFKPWEEWGNDS